MKEVGYSHLHQATENCKKEKEKRKGEKVKRQEMKKKQFSLLFIIHGPYID